MLIMAIYLAHTASQVACKSSEQKSGYREESVNMVWRNKEVNKFYLCKASNDSKSALTQNF